MYFFSGYAIHGAYWHDNFGTPMSHGCVNLTNVDAKWFYDFAEVGTPALAAMLLLDALQPHGITELYTDPNGLIAAMGALTYIVPEAVVQLAEGDSLDYLGTAFSLEGLPRYGEKVGKYQIEYENGEKVEGVITGGAIYVIPLALGRTATIADVANRSRRTHITAERPCLGQGRTAYRIAHLNAVLSSNPERTKHQ